MKNTDQVGVWFPAIRADTGADVFTQRLCDGLNARGIRAEITWLPHRAEYLPWSVRVPKPPDWANVVHVNTWLHPRFIPEHLSMVATLHHSVHDPSLRRYKGWLRAAYHRHWIAPIERQAMWRAAHIVAVSQFAAEMARQTLCDAPIRVIYNGIDTVCLRPPQNRQMHVPFRLLYIGSWMARKGVGLLAPIMRELGDEFVLHYTGGRAAAKDKPNMPPNMIDIGRLRDDQVVKVMQQSDALLFPSRSEGFGLVVVESMACGLPVIATCGSSLPELVDEGVTGTLCPQDDVGAFVCAIQRLRTDPLLWDQMSSSAIARAREKFSAGAALDLYCQVYSSVTCKHVLSHRVIES